MKPTKPAGVAHLIGTCPIHTAIVRAVGYGKLPCKDVIATLTEVIAKHGQAAVDDVCRNLLDYEQHATTLYAFLKPQLHVYCRMLLGPMPSEWETWWQNPDGTDRPGKPKVWPPKLPGPPPPTKEEVELRDLPLSALAERLHAARARWHAAKPSSRTVPKIHAEILSIQAEYRRRGLVIPESPSQPVARTKKGAG